MRLRHPAHRDPHRDGGQRQIDQEDRPPVHILGEQAAQYGAGRGRGAADAAPDAERHAPVPALIRGHQQRGGGGEHRRRARPLHGAGRDQHARVRGQTAGQGGEREQRQPGHIQPTPPQEVRGRTRHHQQRGQRQRIDVQHPLERGEGGAQAVGYPGQRGVHDRHIDQQQNIAEGDGGQRPPLPARSRAPSPGRSRAPSPGRSPATGCAPHAHSSAPVGRYRRARRRRSPARRSPAR